MFSPAVSPSSPPLKSLPHSLLLLQPKNKHKCRSEEKPKKPGQPEDYRQVKFDRGRESEQRLSLGRQSNFLLKNPGLLQHKSNFSRGAHQPQKEKEGKGGRARKGAFPSRRRRRRRRTGEKFSSSPSHFRQSFPFFFRLIYYRTTPLPPFSPFIRLLPGGKESERML